MGIAVFIATTAGPVRVERIVGETVPQSNVFIGRGYKPLEPISADYDDFVAPGGPVVKAFGPFESASFRLDLSGPIDTGNSWELAVFVAHGLAKAGRLAVGEAEVKAVVLLTGRVDTDLAIAAVGHIVEKVKAARHLSDACKASGTPFQFIVPDSDDLSAALKTGFMALVPVASAEQAMKGLIASGSLEFKSPPLLPPTEIQQKAQSKTKSSLCLIMFTMVAIGTGFLILADDPNIRPAQTTGPILDHSQARDTQQETRISNKERGVVGDVVKVFERRAPKGESCAQVQFGGTKASEIIVPMAGPAEFRASSISGLCGLRFHVTLSRLEDRGILRIIVKQGAFIGADTNALPLSGVVEFKGSGNWFVDLPKLLKARIRYNIEVESFSGAKAVGSVAFIHEVLP